MAMIREVQRLLDRARKAFGSDTPMDRRSVARVPVHTVTILTAAGERQDAKMRDVSPDGAKIVSPHQMLPGTQLTIELPDLPAPVTGQVVHVNGLEVGVRFDTPGSGLVIAGWAAGRHAADGDDDLPHAAGTGG